VNYPVIDVRPDRVIVLFAIQAGVFDSPGAAQ